MDFVIQSLGFTAGEELEGFVKEKLGKLENLSDKIIRADVTLYVGADGDVENKFCEVRLEVPGNDHFVKKNAETFEAAVNDVTSTLQNVMRRSKEKMTDRRHGSL